VSSLEWGWDAMQLPETIIGTAFGLVAFPTLAGLAAQGDRDGLRRTLGESLRMVLALAVPAAAGLILLGRPLLALLYQRGEFDEAATAAVYATLRMYALGLTGHVCLELAARAYFAQKDTVTPLLLAIGSAVLNIALALVLMQSLGAPGLALANSVAVTLEVLALLWFLRPRLGGVEGRETAGQLVRVLGASLVMAGGIMGALAAGQSVGLDGLMLLAAAGAAGALTYLAAAWVLRVREVGRFAAAVFR
jgi:putative peptidoglycan lipid II flippase